MTGGAFRYQPSTPPVALIAGEVGMFSQQRPRMIERLGRDNLSGFGNRRFLSDDRVAELAFLPDDLSVPAYVIALVTAKAAGI